MGIDVFQSRNKYNDRNQYYKRSYVDNMKLNPGAVSEGVFYSTDVIPLEKQTIVMGSVKKTAFTITVETLDSVENLDVDDYVLYSDGNLYIVDNIVAEDTNENKEFSKRPSFKTTIRLRKWMQKYFGNYFLQHYYQMRRKIHVTWLDIYCILIMVTILT